MYDNSLSQWLRDHDLFIKKDDPRPVTHLCMDGGKFTIPMDLQDSFNEQYRRGIAKGEKYFICEVPTNVSRMYVDMDFITALAQNIDLSTEQAGVIRRQRESEMTGNIPEYVKTIKDVVAEYYGDRSIIVCTADVTTTEKNKKEYIKHGIHLIWPNLYVDQPTAIKLAKLFIVKLRKKFGERPEENLWADVIDTGVYGKSLTTLRMVGSRKMGRGKKGKFEDQGRPYVPEFMLGKNGTIRNVTMDIMGQTFLRVFEAPSEPKKDIMDVIVSTVPPKGSLKEAKTLELKESDPVIYEIERFINDLGVGSWDSASVRGVKKSKNFYTVKVEGTMYCMNKDDEHKSCGIYFVITDTGLRQKCYCPCDTTAGRQFGVCSNYTSTAFPLPGPLKTKLFGLKDKPEAIRKSFNVDNCFPTFAILDTDPVRFESMIQKTIEYFDKRNVKTADLKKNAIEI